MPEFGESTYLERVHSAKVISFWAMALFRLIVAIAALRFIIFGA